MKQLYQNFVYLTIGITVLQGSYKIKLQFLSPDDEQLACANIDFSIVWNKSVAESLDTFNPIKLHKHMAHKEAPVAHT